MKFGFAVFFVTEGAARAFAKEIAPSVSQINDLREEFMANIEELKAAAAAERAQVQEKLKELADSIAALQGQVLTAEQVAELKADIENISEPAA